MLLYVHFEHKEPAEKMTKSELGAIWKWGSSDESVGDSMGFSYEFRWRSDLDDLAHDESSSRDFLRHRLLRPM